MKDKRITPRAEDYSQWYLDVIAAADMAEHSPVKGCMVIKPWGYALWERTQQVLDAEFKKVGVENAYFPLFVPKSFLEKEEGHAEGFAKECAIITHYRLKADPGNPGKLIVDPEAKLEEELIVRPTSETIMYDTFRDWIHSYRDLPLLINQWANVVRWEMRTRLFLRTTEFLWQEGHTAHTTQEEADAFARRMLEVYRKFAEEVLAIPVIVGEKVASEKFAGADRTYCLEAMMQDGKALQFSTSHNLGQNFAKAFGVKFTDEQNKEQFVWQTSWGLSTRTIGALIMAHGDDQGLVLPPRLAAVQAVVIPLWFKDGQKEGVMAEAEKVMAALEEAGVRIKMDRREGRPGEKIFGWEKKGVPVRIEIGPKDIEAGRVIVARRDTGEKKEVPVQEAAETVVKILEDMHETLFARAKTFTDTHTRTVSTWEELTAAMEAGCFALAPWDGSEADEKRLKDDLSATVRCIPLDAKAPTGACVASGRPATKTVVIARAY